MRIGLRHVRLVVACAMLAAALAVVALSATPTRALPFTYTSVSTGYHRTCAVTTDGVGLCWGWNHAASLGTSDRSSSVLTPAVVTLPAGERFRYIEAGSYFSSCGLTVSGNVYCWGEAGPPGRLLLPADAVVDQLSVGASQVCALTTNRHLYCHGDWNSGELGVGDMEYTHLPVRIELPDSAVPAQVSGGIGFTCVVATSGDAYCSGVNAAGQLGNGTTGPTRRFTRVALPSGVTLVSVNAGLERACALDTNGRGWCWGRNYNGALGDGTYGNSHTPRAVALADGVRLTDIRTGWYHTCGLTTSGSVLCWGENSGGSLGWGGSYGGKTIRTAALPDGVVAQHLTIGLSGTCIASTDSRVFCWGSNLRGSAGTGSTAPVYTPAEILRVGTPDPTAPLANSVSTHDVSFGGTFVPNGAASTITLLVAESSDFNDARRITVSIPRVAQSNLAQLYAPVRYSAWVTGLRPGTTYHVRAVASNAFGTNQSDTTVLTTLGAAPVIVGAAASRISGDSVAIDAVVDPNLLDTAVSVTYSTRPDFLDDVSTVHLGSARSDNDVQLSTNVDSLRPRTTYWVVVTATNEVGSVSGATFSFTTVGSAPRILSPATAGGRRSATVTFNVDPGLLRTTVVVAHRKAGTSAGWVTERREIADTATGMSFDIRNLEPATTYDVQISATNAVGDDVVDNLAFVTTGGAPAITDNSALDVGDFSVTLRSTVDTNDFATRVTLQIDTDTSFGNYDEWFAGSLAAGSVRPISLDVSELLDSTTYYARFVASNSRGTTIGEVVEFTTTTPVGKLLKRRVDPVDPLPVVEPTPLPDEDLIVVASVPSRAKGRQARAATVRTSANRAALRSQDAKVAAPKTTPTKKKNTRTDVRKTSAKKKSVAR